MSFKTTYVLFGLLIAQLVIFGWVQLAAPVPGDDNWVLPRWHRDKVQAAQVASVEIAPAKGPKLVFARDENKRWTLKEPYTTRVEETPIDDLVRELVDAQRVDVELGRNLKQYDLDPPATVITLTRADGTTAQFNIGKTSLGERTKQVVYVSSSERPRDVLAVRRPSLDNAFRDAKDFRRKDLLGEGPNVLFTYDKAKLSAGMKTLTVAKKGSSETSWKLEEPNWGDADLGGNPDIDSKLDPKADPAKARKIAGVQALLNTIDSLKVEYSPDGKDDDFVAENVKDMEQYGLGDTPATLRIDVDKKVRSGSERGPEIAAETKTVADTLLIGKPVDEKKDRYFARLKGETNVVKVSGKAVESLLEIVGDPLPLRNKDLLTFDESKVDAVDIQNAAGMVRLRRVGEPPVWKVYEDGKLRDADRAAVSTLLNTLTTRRQVKAYPDKPDAELGFDKAGEAAVVSIWVDGIEKDKKEVKKDAKDDKKEPAKDDKKDKDDKKEPAKDDKKDKDDKKEPAKDDKKDKDEKEPKSEPKDEKVEIKLKPEPTVKLIFGKKDGDVVFVKREEGKDVAKLAVPEGLLARVSEGRLAYLDRTLPGFPPGADVVKIAIVRPGEVIEAIRNDKFDWEMVKPKDQAGRPAEGPKVRAVADAMRRIFPDKLVAEKPDAKQLAEFGLDNPEYKVTITVKASDKDKEKEYTYLFGKPEKKDGPIYAKLADNDLVFLVQPAVLTDVKTELIGTKVFNFDPGKVEAIRLTWKKKPDAPSVLDIVRKDKKWVLRDDKDKELSGFVLDHAKVETLVFETSRLQADRFLAFKSGPRPQDELGDKERNLQIEIFLEGGDKDKPVPPLTLTIGKLSEGDKDKVEKDKRGFACQASTLPGDVFFLPGPGLEQLIDKGVKYFEVEKKKE